ncbi:MAG: isochorismatase family protein [Microthrixaceae bacterium]
MSAALVEPSTTAVVTMECQRGVVGDLAGFPELGDAVRRTGMLDRAAALLDAARAAGVFVVHATAVFREDRVGSSSNAPLLRRAASMPGQLLEGSPAAELAPELGFTASDAVSPRRHGVSPFSGTDLDAILRSRGVRTVVGIGASLNVGVMGLAIEAVNLGYEVVLPTDAVVAVPPEAAADLLAVSLRALCTVSNVDELRRIWSRPTADAPTRG